MSNPIVGQSGVEGGAGAVTTKTQRAVLATDQSAIPVAQSGTWDEVGINDSGNSITVDQATGTNLHTVVDSGVITTVSTVTTVTNIVHVDDNAGNLSIDDGGNSITVDNGGTFLTQENGAALTALQLIDDIVYTDDTSTHATGTSKGALMMAAAVPTDTSVNANDIGAVAMTTDRRLLVDASGVAIPITDNAGSLTVDYATTGSGTATGALRVELPTNGTGVIATVSAVTAITNALPAGTNAIGKLSTNSGVDIGDVDVTSISAGTNAIGNVGVIPRTTGGLTPFHLVSAATTNATNVKASAGQLFGWDIYNSNAAMRKITFHNSAGTPTAGASVFFTKCIPGLGAANVFLSAGIAFGTGIAITTTTDLADNGTTAVAANDLNINLFYA